MVRFLGAKVRIPFNLAYTVNVRGFNKLRQLGDLEYSREIGRFYNYETQNPVSNN